MSSPRRRIRFDLIRFRSAPTNGRSVSVYRQQTKMVSLAVTRWIEYGGRGYAHSVSFPRCSRDMATKCEGDAETTERPVDFVSSSCLLDNFERNIQRKIRLKERFQLHRSKEQLSWHQARDAGISVCPVPDALRTRLRRAHRGDK